MAKILSYKEFNAQYPDMENSMRRTRLTLEIYNLLHKTGDGTFKPHSSEIEFQQFIIFNDGAVLREWKGSEHGDMHGEWHLPAHRPTPIGVKEHEQVEWFDHDMQIFQDYLWDLTEKYEDELMNFEDFSQFTKAETKP